MAPGQQQKAGNKQRPKAPPGGSASPSPSGPRRASFPRTGGPAPEIPINKIFFAVLTVSVVIVCVYIELTRNISENLRKSVAQYYGNTSQVPDDTLVVADNMDAGYLDHVVDALLKHGYKLAFTGKMTPKKAKEIDQYQLIWSHDYPFTDVEDFSPFQRINHFPGTGFITNKMSLSTTPRVPHLLKAFRLPAEKDRFLRYAQKNPQAKWIQKSSSHRGISIETAESVRFDLPNTLVQEYMANPLLIDGKKFDIGIYAVLTSIEPLRVYIYNAESLLRFCAHPYLDKTTGEFNSSDIDSFVVGDDYTPIWLMPSLLRLYIGANMSMKQTLNTYLKQLGKSGDGIWSQIEETIKNVYKMKEHHMASLVRYYQQDLGYSSTSVEGSLGQYFEMVRFDFIIDEHLNVFLMEANMSPNLSSRHFPPNRLIYEQVLNSYFSLVGLNQFIKEQLADLPITYLNGTSQGPRQAKPSGQRHGLDALISDKELSVYEELCVSDECHMNCEAVDCKTCFFCLSYADKLHIRRAIYEHNFKWDFKRILPSTRDSDLDLQLLHPETKEQNIDANYLHVQWFRGKCHTDKRFCNLDQLELKEPMIY